MVKPDGEYNVKSEIDMSVDYLKALAVELQKDLAEIIGDIPDD